MSASLAGYFNFQAIASDGDLAEDFRLYTYTAGTTTHKQVYTEPTGSTPHTYTSDGIGGQYIACNARGELAAPLYLTAGAYDLTLKTPGGSTIWTRRAEGTDDTAAELDTALRAELAATDDEDEGAGMVGFDHVREYEIGTVGWALIKGTYNVAARGALGDGTTDDSAIFQAGLTAGRWIEVPNPSSYYKITSALAMPQDAGIIGESRERTIIRKSGGGSVITCDGSSGDGGPYLIRNVRLGGSGAIGITELAGGYANYISRLQLDQVSTEGDLLTGIDANLIYFNANEWWDGYDVQSSVNASHRALVASFGGASNTNLNLLEKCAFFESNGAYAVNLSGGLLWRFVLCDWTNNVRNMTTSNIQGLQLVQSYTERCNPVTGQVFDFGAARTAIRVLGGDFNGSDMAAGTSMFGATPGTPLLVEGADIVTSASAYAYIDTTSLVHFPSSGKHHFRDNRYSGNASDPLYFLDNLREDAPNAWTPVPSGLTLAASPGTATYSGFWSIRNRMATVSVRIVPDGSSTSAATGSTTYFTLPTGIPAPAYNAAGSVYNESTGSLGSVMAYSNGRMYMPTWSAQTGVILATVTYPF